MIPAPWFARARDWYDGAPLPIQVAVPAAAIFLISVAAPSGVPPFIYFQF